MTLSVTLSRTDGDKFSTLGLLRVPGVAPTVYTLERAKAFAEHPRVPAGTYALELKPLGSSHFDKRMIELLGNDHHGMIRLKDVPGTTDILIHIANYWHELLGCIAPGFSYQHGPDPTTDPAPVPNPSTYWIQNSTLAYKRVYITIRDAIENGGAEIKISDEPEQAAIA